MDDQSTRSRVLGFLLWSAFAVTSLLVVMFTFIAAFGNENDRYYPTGPTMPSPMAPSISPVPLCFEMPDASPSTAKARIDVEAARIGLVAKTDWTQVAPHAPIPSVVGECSLIAVVPETTEHGFTIEGPTVACASQPTFTIVCPTPVKNGATPILSRVFTVPAASLSDVTSSRLPPLVHVTHVLIERELLHTPYRAGGGVTDFTLVAGSTTRAPTRTSLRCFVWVGVDTAGSVVSYANATPDCGQGIMLPAATQSDMHVFLRPYARAPGPHRELSAQPASTPLRSMALIEDSRLLSTLPQGS